LKKEKTSHEKERGKKTVTKVCSGKGKNKGNTRKRTKAKGGHGIWKMGDAFGGDWIGFRKEKRKKKGNSKEHSQDYIRLIIKTTQGAKKNRATIDAEVQFWS